MKKTCIVIAGPTAVGKTALAIQVARHFSTEIISADSRQCYKELNIGVAKPSRLELESVPHHFIDSHSIHETVNAAIFEKYALQQLAEIHARYQVAVMVGGTGLYIKSFCAGIDEVPAVAAGIKEQIVSNYNAYGMEWLQQQVKSNDPAFYTQGEMQNPHRVMRALEVMQGTGRSILSYHGQTNVRRDFNIIKIALGLPRPDLYERINKRTTQMIADGLTEEVRSLLEYKDLKALQTVGYTEIFNYLEGGSTLDFAIEAIRKNTRHYAKRQMTWFQKDKEFAWFEPSLQPVLAHIQRMLDVAQQ